MPGLTDLIKGQFGLGAADLDGDGTNEIVVLSLTCDDGVARRRAAEQPRPRNTDLRAKGRGPARVDQRESERRLPPGRGRQSRRDHQGRGGQAARLCRRRNWRASERRYRFDGAASGRSGRRRCPGRCRAAGSAPQAASAPAAATKLDGEFLPVCLLERCLNPRVQAKNGVGTASASVEAKVTTADATAWCAKWNAGYKGCVEDQVAQGGPAAARNSAAPLTPRPRTARRASSKPWTVAAINTSARGPTAVAPAARSSRARWAKAAGACSTSKAVRKSQTVRPRSSSWRSSRTPANRSRCSGSCYAPARRRRNDASAADETGCVVRAAGAAISRDLRKRTERARPTALPSTTRAAAIGSGAAACSTQRSSAASMSNVFGALAAAAVAHARHHEEPVRCLHVGARRASRRRLRNSACCSRPRSAGRSSRGTESACRRDRRTASGSGRARR